MSNPTSLIARYLADVHELDEYLSGKPITLTGSDLSLPQIAAIALYAPATHANASYLLPHAPPLHLTASQSVRSKHAASRHVISSKVEAGLSIYGVSTGFGGSADTRTDDPIALGAALLQHQHAGVLTPSSVSRTASVSFAPMPLTDPTHSTTMPPPWTRAAMLVRTNSLLRGHSGVRWELVEKMVEVIQKGLVPLVPLRGSISASGDLSSLSYIAGMLIGNPAIRVWMLSPPAPPSLPSLSIPTTRLEAPAPQPPLPVSTLTSASVSRTTSPAFGSGSLSPTSPSTPASSLPDEDILKADHFSIPSSQSAPSQISTYSAPTSFSSTYTAPKALALTHTTPLPLVSKEHLGILNGTAFSAGLAALVVNAASGIGVLGAVLTALSVEAVLGSRDSFDPFVGHARPHPGQIESAHLIWSLLSGSKFSQNEEIEVKIEDDQGVLRQDRYSLRTAPQWLGPQFEDIKKIGETVRIEVNSTTDNPLVEPPSEVGGEGKIHHAGNFQALALTNAMDHLRLSLSHIGRLMFVQVTEIVNPAMNRGLPGNLAGGEGALDFGCKGLDIAAAAYAGELNALGGMNVGVGSVSAEMHNQSVNSLALVSARYTLSALEVSQLLAATHLFVVCQALDCRALCVEMSDLSTQVVAEVLREAFNLTEGDGVVDKITRKMMPQIQDALDRTSAMDTAPRMDKVAWEAVAPLVESITSLASSPSPFSTTIDLHAFDLSKISTFRTALARKLEALLTELKCAYLGVELGDVGGGVSASSSGASEPTSLFNFASRGPAPASCFLAPRTRILYEFVRKELGIGMHGADNLRRGVFGMRSTSVGDDDLPGLSGVSEDTKAGLGEKVDTTVGDKVSIIVEAIRDGRIARVLARVCEGVDV
ncbi:hypothetical protein PAXINDRAFT_19982 [Paxillus involutus ATCC 200175]|uniref:Phenylalanine ammonia-lyase n=1 Tax=Paxillus involutus ATCC 200175 TaxID=664439 RepID=A0A0C9THK5_PAXIN|nr:hypothetical protein PAXINDRAFT_19982 [Paxillus involutus ATCC 200175]